MSKLAIRLHASDPPSFETTDEATVEEVRKALGPEASHLVPAHDLAAIVKTAGRKHWASVLGHEEESHMVTVVFS